MLDGCSENAEKHTFDIHLASKSLGHWKAECPNKRDAAREQANVVHVEELSPHDQPQVIIEERTSRTHCKRAKSSSLAPLPPPLQPPQEKPLPRDFDSQKPLDLRLSLILGRASWYDAMTPVRFVSPECFTSSLQIHSQTAAQRGRLHRLPGQVSQGPLLSAHRLLHAIPDRSGTMWSGIILWRTLNVTGFHIVGCVHLLANITRSKQPFC